MADLSNPDPLRDMRCWRAPLWLSLWHYACIHASMPLEIFSFPSVGNPVEDHPPLPVRSENSSFNESKDIKA